MEKKTITLVRETVQSIIGVDINAFDANRKINTISEWDSFNNLMLIMKFQELLGVEFSAMDLEKTQSINDLLALIHSKMKK